MATQQKQMTDQQRQKISDAMREISKTGDLSDIIFIIKTNNSQQLQLGCYPANLPTPIMARLLHALFEVIQEDIANFKGHIIVTNTKQQENG